MATRRDVTGYSTLQVALHWIVVVLVAFQFVAHDAMEAAWRAWNRGEIPSPDLTVFTYMHIGAGALILLLALMRLYLRMTRGVPAPPADEPRIQKWASEGVHVLIYVLLILLPLSGSTAWFLGVELAGEAHEIMQNFLLGAIGLHIAGALYQHFVRRSQVLVRMFRPERH